MSINYNHLKVNSIVVKLKYKSLFYHSLYEVSHLCLYVKNGGGREEWTRSTHGSTRTLHNYRFRKETSIS